MLADIDGRGDSDATYHLGDLVGYAPWPNETVALVRAAGIPGVAGNYDSTVATDYKHCGCKYEDPRAGYVRLVIDAEGVRSEIVRVVYDVERAAQGILASTLPAEFAAFLRTGGATIRA